MQVRKTWNQSVKTAYLGVAAALACASVAQTPFEGVGSPGTGVAPATGDSELAVEDAARRVALGEYVEAINIVELEIETIERRSNRYDIELVEPLVVLGGALVGVGDREGALGAYDRALHVNRVNRGLHHPSQVDIVYREAELLAATGERARANKRHEYAYGLLLRRYGTDDPALLPGLFALADWYLSSYNIFSARALYEHAVKVADDSLAVDDPARIQALQGVAASYLSERFPPYHESGMQIARSTGTYTGRFGSMPSINSFARGERALIEVINVQKAREGADDEKIGAAILELGDWFLMFEKHERATTLYRRVWQLLSPNKALLAQTFDSPTPLYLPLPDGPANSKDPVGTAKNGVVELSVSVNEGGGVSRIDTLRSVPEDLMDMKVRRAVRRARYRPAFDGQTPVATDGVRISHTFVYFSPASANDESIDLGEASVSPSPNAVVGQADLGTFAVAGKALQDVVEPGSDRPIGQLD